MAPRARTAAPAEHRTADDLDATHDPGPDVARGRLEAAAIDDAATEPLAGPDRPPDPGRDRVLDRPDDDRLRRVLPHRRRHGRGAARLLRVAVPGRGGRRDVLRAAVAAPVRAVGRAHAARLRVRHQGPRAAHRPAHRDEAAAQGDPRGAARRRSPTRRGCTRRTCRASCWPRSGTSSPTGSRRSPRAASWARCSSSTRSGSSPRPRTGTRSARPRRPSTRTG